MVKKRVETMVDDKIQGKKVMIFSKTTCGYCHKAKTIFKEHLGVDLLRKDYEVMEIGSHKDCNDIQDYLKKLTGASSVPRVFINERCIGGGDDVARLERSGKLKKLLEADNVSINKK